MEDSQFPHNELSFKPQTSSYLLCKPLHHSAYEVHVPWLWSLQFLPHLYSKKLRKPSSFQHTRAHLDSVSLWRQIRFCEHQIYPNLCSDENPHFSALKVWDCLLGATNVLRVTSTARPNQSDPNTGATASSCPVTRPDPARLYCREQQQRA